MQRDRLLSRCHRVCLLVIGAAAVAVASTVEAEDAKPIALTRLTPAGGQAGTSVTVTATGEFPNWPVSVWTDRDQLRWEPQEASGTFAVTIPADGAVGLHRVRFTDASGATAIRPFIVGMIPEIVEAEPNNRRDEATALDGLPITINGVLEKSGDVDGYRLQLQAGETLVAAVVANEQLGSPIDAVLELVELSGGYVARNLDAVGLDPRIVHTITRDGDYVVRVYAFPSQPNSTIGLSGSADSLYRLTLTTSGFLTGSLPTVAASDSETALLPTGANLPEPPEPRVMPPPAPESAERSAWLSFPDVAGAVEIPFVPSSLAPQAASQQARHAEVPFVASGWFQQADATESYQVNVSKGQKLQVHLQSQSIGFEADPLLSIRDAAGTSLSSKQERDARFSWTPPEDDTYTFEVRDRRGRFGPGHLYRLTVEPETPAVAASIGADQFTATVGEPLAIDIGVARQFGFSETVEFVLTAAPKGVMAEVVSSPNEGDAAKKVSLTLTATAQASGPLRIGRRVAGSDALEPVVFGNGRLTEAWLTVIPAPPAEDDTATTDNTAAAE